MRIPQHVVKGRPFRPKIYKREIVLPFRIDYLSQPHPLPRHQLRFRKTILSLHREIFPSRNMLFKRIDIHRTYNGGYTRLNEALVPIAVVP
jgi:hypothetical protein